jgi:hypothetical protein
LLATLCRKKGRQAADSDSEYSVSEGGDEGGSPAPAAPPASAAAAAAARADSDGGLSGEDSEDERIRADQELSDDDLDLREANGQVALYPGPIPDCDHKHVT